MAIPIFSGNIPYITAQQMKEVDRAMIEGYHIGLIQMMENAGRNLAHIARKRFLGDRVFRKQVIILAGTGGNGGGALVCARHLHNWGADVSVFLTRPASHFTEAPAHQLYILQHMKLPIAECEAIGQVQVPDLIIDGLIGYSLNGPPHGSVANLITWANAQKAPLLALDVPSGVDASSGVALNPSIKATATMTLALPKKGLRAPGVEPYVGELYLADIGVPPALYAEPALSLQVGHLFAESEILRL